MKDPATKNTRVLGIDKDGAFLPVIQRMMEERCSECAFETVADTGSAAQLILQTTYDLLVVDTQDDSDHALLELASNRGLPVLAVFSHRTRPETLRYFCTPAVRAFISKDRHKEAVEAIERILSEACRPWWKQGLMKLMGVVAESAAGGKYHDTSALYRSDGEIYG
ncbi:MAG: hypothetical protein JRK53_23355, partial [Deltaproteobacteria bacterium]|nr:hypothetical protein [Deltaproteobacteria bacterium]